MAGKLSWDVGNLCDSKLLSFFFKTRIRGRGGTFRYDSMQDAEAIAIFSGFSGDKTITIVIVLEILYGAFFQLSG